MVLIASPDLLPLLAARSGTDAGELLAFSDADALRALAIITERHPQVIALERLFAATPRGAALIDRIKADPSLVESEIRVVSPHASEDAGEAPLRRGADRAASPGESATPPAWTLAPPPPLDLRGTRRAARIAMGSNADAMIDGNAARLVDLSTVGAQVISSTVLKPNQRVRVALPDDRGMLRFSAIVAWASFEIPPQSGPRYRAGINFVDANPPAVEAFCARHRAT
jgi:PilZ domain-containing protein